MVSGGVILGHQCVRLCQEGSRNVFSFIRKVSDGVSKVSRKL